ncbi:hypothetical protein HY480_04535, partial [Candidatus Uhrbacteria bacterium]|nr:hypothetical protein [Candidatus Uhrbacteria bacterium]
MPEFTRSIRLDADGTATYERSVTVPGTNGAPPTDRLIERKRVDAAVVVAKNGVLPLLPMHCRFTVSENGVTVFVTEEQPAVRTVRWDTSHGTYGVMRNRLASGYMHRLWGEDGPSFVFRLRTQQEFSLAFPYLVKCYQFIHGTCRAVTLWYRTRPLEDERAELFIPNLPNRDAANGVLCLTHEAKARMAAQSDQIHETIAFIEQEFWGSWWNADWAHDFCTDAARMPEVASPWEWERASAADPRFVLRVPWRSSERTVGEEVARLLGTPDIAASLERTRLFDQCVQRVQAADSWDGVRAEGHAAIAVSPAQSIVLAHGIELRIGDRVRLTPRVVAECLAGGTYVVEWFGRKDTAGSRRVKLNGVDQPVLLVIGNVLLHGAVHEPQQDEATIVVAGVTIGPGALCVFDSNAGWGRETFPYAVDRAYRDLTGTILVRFRDAAAYTVIGDHDALFPGVRFLPEEDVDPVTKCLRATSLTLRDGTTINIGAVLFSSNVGGLFGRFTVSAIEPFLAGQQYRCVRTISGPRIPVERLDGTRWPHVQVVAEPVTDVELQGTTIRVGQCLRVLGRAERIDEFSPSFGDGAARQQWAKCGERWVALPLHGALPGVQLLPEIIVEPTRFQIGSTVYRAGSWWWDVAEKSLRRAVEFSSASIGDVTVRFADGSTVPCVRDWLPAHEVVPVVVRTQWSGIPIHRGRYVRLRIPHAGLPKGRRFTISHIVPKSGTKPA